MLLKSNFWRINKVINFKLDISFYVIKGGEEGEEGEKGESGFLSFLFDESKVNTSSNHPKWHVLFWDCLSKATQMLEEVWEPKAAWWVYFALVDLDLLSAEQFPSESL